MARYMRASYDSVLEVLSPHMEVMRRCDIDELVYYTTSSAVQVHEQTELADFLHHFYHLSQYLQNGPPIKMTDQLRQLDKAIKAIPMTEDLKHCRAAPNEGTGWPLTADAMHVMGSRKKRKPDTSTQDGYSGGDKPGKKIKRSNPPQNCDFPPSQPIHSLIPPPTQLPSSVIAPTDAPPNPSTALLHHGDNLASLSLNALARYHKEELKALGALWNLKPGRFGGNHGFAEDILDAYRKETSS
ncbi:hypothetical protein BDV98DRAFT_638632 [Pterulicium gracile]|uniref:Uncharacterized protein n=1 Tax=Pterulicium gracile TaxID=1884261 RepID=A0A5C3Q729_9AGAR|nr:hypothetical protein BDV98DRAFT_638632 [Pterula gracilis]